MPSQIHQRAYPFAQFIENIAQAHIVLIQAFCFLCAVLVYGAFGSPTPEQFGIAQAVIAIFLICAVGGGGLLRLISKSKELWVFAARVFAVFGICAGIGLSSFYGHDASLILRDGIAFAFLILPLFFLHYFENDDRRIHIFVLYGVLSVGILFSLRSLFDLPFLGQGDALYYLANSACVLFTALFTLGLAIQVFVTRFSPSFLPRVFVLAGISFLCVLPLIETDQRASVAAYVIGALIFTGVAIWKTPKRGFVVFVIIGGISVLLWPFIMSIIGDLSRKTDLVGANMRAQEWTAVWDVISSHPISMVFGIGWGGTFASPAVADISVNYTHGLLSSLLLKHGVLGLALGAFSVFSMLFYIVRQNFNTPLITIAVCFPTLIDVFLYASYKSLDFGVVMLVGLLLSRHKEWYRFFMCESR